MEEEGRGDGEEGRGEGGGRDRKGRGVKHTVHTCTRMSGRGVGG